MTKNAEKQKGITLIALIITIIVMLILVGVTLNIALGENGLIGKAKYARQKQEEQTILEQIMALTTWDKSGDIEVENTYAKVEEQFNILESYWNPTKTEVRFKTQGEFGIYGYKINTLEIVIDNGELPEAGDYYFTFSELNNNSTDNQIQVGINEGTTNMVLVDAELFWNTVGKSFVAQYGISIFSDDELKTISTREESNQKNFIFVKSKPTNTGNEFNMIDLGKKVWINIIKEGKPIFSEDGTVDGTISWSEFLQEYGDVKFYLDGSKTAKQTFYVIQNLEGITNKNENNIINEGEGYSDELTAESNYTLPSIEDITITMSGKILNNNENGNMWKLENNKIIINIPKVTGIIRIRAEATNNYAQIDFERNGIDLRYSEGSSNWMLKNTAKFKCTFIPNPGYFLPQNVIVSQEEKILTSGIDYIYNSETGEFETTNNITENLTINIKGIPNYEGKYVKYGGKIWVGLYEDSKNLELISQNGMTLSDGSLLTLGENDPKETNTNGAINAINSYNSSVERINDACKEIVENLKINVKETRSLGYVGTIGNYNNNYIYKDIKIKENPSIGLNNIKDYERLDWFYHYGNLNLFDSDQIYWVAEISDCDGLGTSHYFRIASNINNGFTFRDVVKTDNYNSPKTWSYSLGLRPIIKIESSRLTGANGNGTQNDPYILD